MSTIPSKKKKLLGQPNLQIYPKYQMTQTSGKNGF